jgi:hypothetical protein
VKAGGFQPTVESFGLRSGVIRYEANGALESSLPEGLRHRVAAAQDSIIAADSGYTTTP